MKTTLNILVLSLLVISVIPGVFAASVGTGVGVDIGTEDFEPRVWLCGSRIVYDDSTEPGRLFPAGGYCSDSSYNDQSTCEANEGTWTESELLERINNYAFEGEQIVWEVLVMDKNGFEKIKDVYATIGSSQGAGNDIEVNCQFDEVAREVSEECNARILEEELTGDDLSEVAAYYTCALTVETADSMYGEYWVTVEAEDLDGLLGTMDENEYWFFNPVIALSIDGDLTFEDVRPGTSSYSSTLLVGNDADEGSGVMLDMFISGTDFYDSSSSGAKCPSTNQLGLSNFRYFVTNGAYSSLVDPRNDAEGYVPIEYGIGFNNPTPFYESNEILQAQKVGPYYTANLLAPGAEMAITFRLNLPEPCNGDFDTGSIYFWGEAI